LQAPLQTVPLKKENEQRFFDYLDKDRALHIFTIYDVKYRREKTEIWAAFRGEEIIGYLFEYDKRIVHTHGAKEGVTELLGFIDLDELVFVIEPQHLAIVERHFEPVEPTDPSSKGKITQYLVMKTGFDTFQPIIKHRVKRLTAGNLDEASKSLGEEYRKIIENALNGGLAFGAYENGSLASIVTVPEIIEGLAFIRGVYTIPSLRSRGLATSACSALVEEVLRLGKEALLWVAEDNLPARRVYEKVGFEKTGHILLGFKARRRRV
jgi:GNAT superfamily N-acetyltransferase